MPKNVHFYCLFIFIVSGVISAIMTPIMRFFAVRFNIYDHPHSELKTHNKPVPYLGGLAIWIGFIVSLVLVRMITHFPTGTMYNIRAVLLGGMCIIILGIIDDVFPAGIGFRKKFLFQVIATMVLIYFGIRIKFIQPDYVAVVLTLFWVIGITNSLNIIDIIDGLSASIAAISALAFLLIALPTEQVYVNFTAAALAGSCIGFLPFNLSKKKKIFMGDTGSLFLGFTLASLAMGTSYTAVNDIGLFAPILILGIPIYDTVLVILYRLIQKRSPFLGSNDHFALRLEAAGFTRPQILAMACTASIMLSMVAFISTRVGIAWALLLYVFVGGEFILAGFLLYRIKIDE